MPGELKTLGKVAISDWPALRDRLGLDLLGVRQGAGAETHLIVRRQEANVEMEIIPKDSKLSHLLARLFAQAQANPGKPQRTELPSGMRVDVIYGLDGCIRMQISREKVWPSDTEWNTTVKHLPFEGLEIGEPERFEYKRAFYLRASWSWVEGV